jgi:hypothetical protein
MRFKFCLMLGLCLVNKLAFVVQENQAPWNSCLETEATLPAARHTYIATDAPPLETTRLVL